MNRNCSHCNKTMECKVDDIENCACTTIVIKDETQRVFEENALQMFVLILV